MLDSVFNAAQGGSVHYLSGGAADKDVAEALVEYYDLGPDARIRAADNDREGHLAFCDRAAGFGGVSGSNMGHVAGDETGVALHGRRFSASFGLTFDGRRRRNWRGHQGGRRKPVIRRS